VPGSERGFETLCSCKWRTIFAMLPGLEDLVMMVVTPAEVARRAAMILVDIPPVPKAEPALDTRNVSYFGAKTL
jgi:hypothetical protein